MATKVNPISQTLAEYKTVVLNLLLDRGLTEPFAGVLIDGDRQYIEKMFTECGSESEVADEIMPRDEKLAQKISMDCLSIQVPPQVSVFLAQLVDTGLFGNTIEEVAATLVKQQLSTFVGNGFVTLPAINAGGRHTH